MIIHHHYSLQPHNTFRVEAKADTFIEYSSEEELLSVLNRITSPFIHIGSGSNLLFTHDYKGVVLHSNIKGKQKITEDDETVLIEVGAGEIVDDFIQWCLERDLYGLENLSLIPGEIGAAAVQNIGAYGVEICQCIAYVKIVKHDGTRETLQNEKLHYAYRYSALKEKENADCFVTAVGLRLKKHFVAQLGYKALREQIASRHIAIDKLTGADIRRIVIETREAKLPDVDKIGSAGSFFMNPIITSEEFEAMKSKHPAIPHYPLPDGRIKIPAGWLIDQSGWKGKTEGAVGVYAKQALVIINNDHATGKEIYDFSNKIIDDVKKKWGIHLRPEVKII